MDDKRVARLAALVPAWNPGEALDRTLGSISTQSVPVDIYVVDDGSSPALSLSKQLQGNSVTLIRLPQNQGITAALNCGLEAILAQDYTYVSRHDCGDLDHPQRLASQIAYLEDHPEVALVGSSVAFNDHQGRRRFDFIAPQSQAQVARKMRYSAAVVHSSCMFRAQALREVGAYSDRYPHAEDYELFFRMLAAHELRNLKETLVTASYNKAGISIRHRRRSLLSRLAVQARYFEATNPHAYLGMLQTLCLIATPYRLVSRLKSILRVG